jgi:hypothetical protein
MGTEQRRSSTGTSILAKFHGSRLVVRHDVEVPNDVLAFGLDVHRPGVEVHLAHVHARGHALLRGAPGFVAAAPLEMRLVLEHHLLARNLDAARAVG